MANEITYSSESGNATNGRSLKRLELSYKDIVIKFAVNPSDYSQSMPNMANLTQTKGGAWIDAWGGGVPTFMIKGVTGVKGGTNSIDVGYQRWKELERLFETLYQEVTDGEEVKDLIKLYNYTDNEFWYCYPTQQGIELFRSSSKPHLYQYTINLWGIRKIGQPNPSDVNGAVGNINNPDTTPATSTNQSNSLTQAQYDATTDNNALLIGNTKGNLKSLERVKEDAKKYYKELEPFVGGIEGKIDPLSGYNCVASLVSNSSGIISNVTEFKNDSTQGLGSTVVNLLITSSYSNKISQNSHNFIQDMQNLSSNHYYTNSNPYANAKDVIKQRITETDYNNNNTTYTLIQNLQKKSTLTSNDANRVKLVVIEAMRVYIDLYKIYHSNAPSSLSNTERETLIQNLQAIIIRLSYLQTSRNNFKLLDLIENLRKLQKTLTKVESNVYEYL